MFYKWRAKYGGMDGPRQRVRLEPQGPVWHLLRTAAELTHQAQASHYAREAAAIARAGGTQRGLVETSCMINCKTVARFGCSTSLTTLCVKRLASRWTSRCRRRAQSSVEPGYRIALQTQHHSVRQGRGVHRLCARPGRLRTRSRRRLISRVIFSGTSRWSDITARCVTAG